MRRSTLLPALAIAALLAWLVGYPLLMTLLEALGLGGPQGWTLAGFAEFFHRRDEWMALWRSLWISAASVLLAALVGVPLAFLFERTDFPGRRLLGAIVALPVALPPLVGVIAFLFLYGESGFASRAVQSLLGLSAPPWRLVGPGAILLVHAYSMYVYFYLFTRAGLARLDAALLEAAASLGASRARTLFRVTLPLLRPALAGAALLTFMTALASFSAPYLFGGGFRVMTTQIVASKLNGELALAQVETVMLAGLALLGLGAMRRADRAVSVGTGVRGIAPARKRLRGPLARGAAGLFGWLLAILLLLPHAVLLLVSLVPAFTWTAEPFPPVLNLENWKSLFTTPEHLRPVVNSLWMAVVATLLAVALGFAAARLAAVRRDRVGGMLEGLIVVPWAVPGTVCGGPRHHLQRQPALDRPLRADRHPLDPAAGLPGARPAADRPGGPGRPPAARSGPGGSRGLPGGGPPSPAPAGDPAPAPSGSRRRRGARLHHGARGLHRLDRPLHFRHPPHLDRDPFEPPPPGSRDGGGLRRPADDRERRGVSALG